MTNSTGEILGALKIDRERLRARCAISDRPPRADPLPSRRLEADDEEKRFFETRRHWISNAGLSSRNRTRADQTCAGASTARISRGTRQHFQRSVIGGV